MGLDRNKPTFSVNDVTFLMIDSIDKTENDLRSELFAEEDPQLKAMSALSLQMFNVNTALKQGRKGMKMRRKRWDDHTRQLYVISSLRESIEPIYQNTDNPEVIACIGQIKSLLKHLEFYMFEEQKGGKTNG